MTLQKFKPEHQSHLIIKQSFFRINLNEEFKRGPGLWKFNNTLLRDECYLQLVKDRYPGMYPAKTR